MKHFIISSLCIVALTVFGQAQIREPVHVMVDVLKGKPVYYYSGRQVALDKLLDLFSESARTSGADASVMLLFNPQLPIDTMFNVRGIAGKAGLHSIRSFVVDRYWRTMVEIGILQGNIPVPPWVASARKGQAKGGKP